MKECALSEYKHRAEVKLSGHLPNSTKGCNVQYHNMSRVKNP